MTRKTDPANYVTLQGMCSKYCHSSKNQQGVTLTWRNRTGPPCSVGRLTAHQQRYRRRQTTPTDNSEQNHTDLLGGPVKLWG